MKAHLQATGHAVPSPETQRQCCVRLPAVAPTRASGGYTCPKCGMGPMPWGPMKEHLQATGHLKPARGTKQQCRVGSQTAGGEAASTAFMKKALLDTLLASEIIRKGGTVSIQTLAMASRWGGTRASSGMGPLRLYLLHNDSFTVDELGRASVAKLQLESNSKHSAADDRGWVNPHSYEVHRGRSVRRHSGSCSSSCSSSSSSSKSSCSSNSDRSKSSSSSSSWAIGPRRAKAAQDVETDPRRARAAQAAIAGKDSDGKAPLGFAAKAKAAKPKALARLLEMSADPMVSEASKELPSCEKSKEAPEPDASVCDSVLPRPAERGRKRPHSQAASSEEHHLRDWLLGLDSGSGALLQYADALMNEFDGCLQQIGASFYSACESKSILASVDPVFWEAVGVERFGHKMLFARGLAKLQAIM